MHTNVTLAPGSNIILGPCSETLQWFNVTVTPDMNVTLTLAINATLALSTMQLNDRTKTADA